MTLLERTQHLLSERTNAGVSLRQIAEASGGAINLWWLKKFEAKKIKNPGVNTIESLHDCLKKLSKSN